MKSKYIIPFSVLLMFLSTCMFVRTVSAEAREVTPKVFALDTKTDGNGHFTVQHGIKQSAPAGHKYDRIAAITVAVQHKNKGWYTIMSWAKEQRYAWDDTNISGVIKNADFYRQKVRILIYTIPTYNPGS